MYWINTKKFYLTPYVNMYASPLRLRKLSTIFNKKKIAQNLGVLAEEHIFLFS